MNVIVWLGAMDTNKIFKLITIILEGDNAMEKNCGRRLGNIFWILV